MSVLVLMAVTACKTDEGSSRAPTVVAQTALPPSAPPTSTVPLAASASAPAATVASTGSEQSPFRSGRRLTGSAADQELFNAWATRASLRDDLYRLIVAGLPLQADVSTTIDVRYEKGESPNGAVVTVTQDGFLDDSVRGERFTLRFSRKACSTCASGKSGWWLYGLGATRICWEGCGAQDFSAEPCH